MQTNQPRKATTQTTRVNGKRVVIRTSAKGKITVKEAPVPLSRKAKGRRLRSAPCGRCRSTATSSCLLVT